MEEVTHHHSAVRPRSNREPLEKRNLMSLFRRGRPGPRALPKGGQMATGKWTDMGPYHIDNPFEEESPPARLWVWTCDEDGNDYRVVHYEAEPPTTNERLCSHELPAACAVEGCGWLGTVLECGYAEKDWGGGMSTVVPVCPDHKGRADLIKWTPPGPLKVVIKG